MPMTAVKGGAATRADWRSLVDLMKSADNRAVYDVTLGMVLWTDDGEKGGGCGGGRRRDTGRQFGWRTRRAKLLRDEGVAEDSWE